MYNTPIIETKNLFKQFKGVKAVNNLNLTVLEGDIYGFLGPNGAGKSTTIRLLLSLIYPDKGQMFLFGKSLLSHREKILNKVGALVEKPDFYLYLSAYKNLEILAKLSGLRKANNRIVEVLEMVGLKERMNSRVKTFSQGMKQRLGIAQAILHDPELIILDEPGNGLDPQGTKDMRKLIIRLNKEFNKTIFISSHLLHEIEMISNRMIIINKGEKVVEGNVKDLLNSEKIIVNMQASPANRAIDIIMKKFPDANAVLNENESISLNLEREKISVLNKILVDAGVEIYHLSSARSLEEYFLTKT